MLTEPEVLKHTSRVLNKYIFKAYHLTLYRGREQLPDNYDKMTIITVLFIDTCVNKITH